MLISHGFVSNNTIDRCEVRRQSSPAIIYKFLMIPSGLSGTESEVMMEEDVSQSDLEAPVSKGGLTGKGVECGQAVGVRFKGGCENN